MSVITEAALRVLLKDEDLEAMKEYRVDEHAIVTPSARAWLIDNKIDLLVGDKRVIKNPAGQEQEQKGVLPAGASVLPSFEKPACYKSIYGGFYEEKPEHMTALYGNTLVFKDHKIICLRGRLDSLEAQILQAQLVFQRLGLAKGVAELEEMLTFVKEILRCEVRCQPLEPMCLFGMDDAEIRSRSHAPQKYYNMLHFAPSVQDGEAVLALNTLRTEVREVEIAAYETFKKENGEAERADIIQALNRLSSAFYVMMFKVKSGEYSV